MRVSILLSQFLQTSIYTYRVFQKRYKQLLNIPKVEEAAVVRNDPLIYHLSAYLFVVDMREKNI